MKTKYQTPEIEVLTLYAQDVITASSPETTSSGLSGVKDTYTGGSSLQWGDIWG